MNYQFDKEHISQHVVKYGVDVRPPIILKQDKTKLQDYCNSLIEQFPQVFETLVAGPRQLRIQNTFMLSNNKRAEMPTFILTAEVLFLIFRSAYTSTEYRILISRRRTKYFAKPWMSSEPSL
jgi:hypothetical protein